MRLTFEQIAIVGIALYVLNKYLDYKVESWIEYYLQRKQEVRHQNDHFSSLSPSQIQDHATASNRFYINGETRDPSSYLPRGPYTQNLEPVYSTAVTAGEGKANRVVPLLDPLQAWRSTPSMAPVTQVQSVLPVPATEPERAVCIGQSFQPISSPDGPYTTSLRPIEDSENTGTRSALGNIAPLGADHYPSGMSGGLHETSLLSSDQMTARSRRRDGEIYRYMQELDDPYGTNPAEALTPFTKQWTA